MRLHQLLATVKYSYDNTPYFLNMEGYKEVDAVQISAKMPMSAMDYFSIDESSHQMMIVCDDGTVSFIPLSTVCVQFNSVFVVSPLLTDTASLDWTLEHVVTAIRNGM